MFDSAQKQIPREIKMCAFPFDILSRPMGFSCYFLHLRQCSPKKEYYGVPETKNHQHICIYLIENIFLFTNLTQRELNERIPNIFRDKKL